MSTQDGFSPLDSAQEMLKSFWGGLNMPLPGMMAPTLDVDELEKRITDMKAVEGWLKMNLNMLQMTIQGLEMQKATIGAMRQAGAGTPNFEEMAHLFANPALWPWSLMQGVQGGGAETSSTPEPANAGPGDADGKTSG